MEESRTLPLASPSASPHLSASSVATLASEDVTAASNKRPSPDQEDREATADSASKKRRVEAAVPVFPPPEKRITAVVDSTPLFDDEPAFLIRRAAALALEHVGFDGATKEALESFCGEIESYAKNFLSHVTLSMLSARRSLPIPPDFEYALRREGLTARLLKPHLKVPIPASRVQPRFSFTPEQETVHQTAPNLLGEELSGDSEKLTLLYIPKDFPSFPSKHTYKFSEVKLERETDPRKIREKATEEARRGEEALRRLVRAGKTTDHKFLRKAPDKKTKLKERTDMWKKAMQDLTIQKPPSSSFGGDGADDQRVLVDAGIAYVRKPVDRRRI